MRKRRTKYQWFLPVGTVGPGADTEDTTNGIERIISVPVNGTSAVQLTHLVMDQPSDDILPGQPMGFYSANEYFIKRIVGKVFVSLNQQANATTAQGVLVGAGLFVARAADDDQSPGVPVPIAGTSASAQVDEYSPLRAENIHEPWIWRRVWQLGNQLTTIADFQGISLFPRTNADYGSVADGAHLDAKTARRVGENERLWFIVAARNLPLNAVVDNVSFVRAYIDYRVLGAMRRTRNRGVF